MTPSLILEQTKRCRDTLIPDDGSSVELTHRHSHKESLTRDDQGLAITHATGILSFSKQSTNKSSASKFTIHSDLCAQNLNKVQLANIQRLSRSIYILTTKTMSTSSTQLLSSSSLRVGRQLANQLKRCIYRHQLDRSVKRRQS